MTIASFNIRQGCSAPYLEVQLTKDGIVLPFCAPKVGCIKPNVNAIDLTNANVTFELKKAARYPTNVAIGGQVKVIECKHGIVQYQWSPQDTMVIGLYYGSFVVTFIRGQILRWPYQLEALSIDVTI